MTYRNQFASDEQADAYDRQQYEVGSHGDVLWRIEQEQLRQVVAELRMTHAHIDYLDFATGTGRVLHFLEPMTDTATGIEISPAMAERARAGGNAVVLCRDITTDQAIEGQYDLITAFRFVLNAEPALRAAGLAALARRLRGPESRLVVNNHGNLHSHKVLSALARARSRQVGPVTEGNLLSHRGMVDALHVAGLEVVAQHGSGLLPGRLHNRFAHARLAALENRAARLPLARAGVNQMYVVRRRTLHGVEASRENA